MCRVPWAEPNTGSYSFCCDCGIRLHDLCKIKWYSNENVTENRCGFCRGKDELFQRDANFWGGRWKRQQLLEDGKIVKCEYRLPSGKDVQKTPGGGALAVGWFWTDDNLYFGGQLDKFGFLRVSGVVHLPTVKVSTSSCKGDIKRHYADYIA